jgi:hypothetical protein
MGDGILSRVIIITLMLVILLILPYFTEIAHTSLYYIGVILLVGYTVFWSVSNWRGKLEENFYRRWHKARASGFWINVIRSALRSLLTMLLIIGFTQLVVNGVAALEIGLDLSTFELLFVIAIFSTFSLIIGMVEWYGNEKRFDQITRSRSIREEKK